MAIAPKASEARASGPLLEARDLAVARPGDDRLLLEKVNLTLDAGSLMSLEGPSGCGKSSLLRVLADLASATHGSLTFAGKAVGDYPPSAYRTKVAFVAQQAPMFEGTVADNLAAGPSFRGEPLTPSDVHALLARVALPSTFAKRSARDLSGGERQRVALARAFANGPALLLLDEPTAGLDPEAAEAVLAGVVDAARGGLAFVVVTHVAAHARRLGAARYRCEGGTLIASPPGF